MNVFVPSTAQARVAIDWPLFFAPIFERTMQKIQFSIKEILGAMALVALSVSLYFQYSARHQAESKLESVLVSDLIIIWPDRTNQAISHRSSISQGCTVHLKNGALPVPDNYRFEIELREVGSGILVHSFQQDNVAINGDGNLSLAFTLEAPRDGWNPSLHVLRITMFEGERAITRSSMELEVITDQ